MKIIDFHTHVFHPKVAHLAIDKLENHYGYKWQCTGTIEDLEQNLDSVYRAVVFATPTKPEQTQINNNYLMGIKNEKLIVFGSLHPDYEDVEGEIKRVKENGLSGFKFHPDFQGFDVDSEKALEMYEKIGPDYPIMLHIGDKKFNHSAPKRLEKVLDIFPKHKFIAAHLGGYSTWDDEGKCLIGKKLWIDTSSALMFLTPERATEIIKNHGVDKVLFGSDYPSVTVEKELEFFNKLKLTKREKEKILYKNAEKLLKLNG